MRSLANILLFTVAACDNACNDGDKAKIGGSLFPGFLWHCGLQAMLDPSKIGPCLEQGCGLTNGCADCFTEQLLFKYIHSAKMVDQRPLHNTRDDDLLHVHHPPQRVEYPRRAKKDFFNFGPYRFEHLVKILPTSSQMRALASILLGVVAASGDACTDAEKTKINGSLFPGFLWHCGAGAGLDPSKIGQCLERGWTGFKLC
ncbi:hypothetical protein FOL47_003616 [Perkinsus chesapeaki]|uniref:Uncharacterized protein n=1 Tax=Perkinsus chesapeaki TaxID=330153 RepID=A0A7J6M850_PERCH|nr:hypothetical protein FOL47_003616 [Perkinsus chesapeaki]